VSHVWNPESKIFLAGTNDWGGANEGTKLNKPTPRISKHNISLLVYFYLVDYLEGYTGSQSVICKPVMFSDKKSFVFNPGSVLQ